MLAQTFKGLMKKAFAKAMDKKEVYRLLKVAETLGLTWGTRHMYGGGIEVSLYDGIDLTVMIYSYKDSFEVRFDDDYFKPDFIPHKVVYYNEETLAEIRNEEALYQYEMLHYYIAEDYDAVGA